MSAAAEAPSAAPPAAEPAAAPTAEPASEQGVSIAHGEVATADAERAAAGEAPAAAPAPAGPLDAEHVAGMWPAIIEQLRQSGAGLLAAILDAARPVSVEGDRLRVGFPEAAAFNRRKAEAKENRDLLADAIRTVLGSPLYPEFTSLEEGSAPVAAAGEEAPGADGASREDELYRRFVAEFDAEVVVGDEVESGPPEGMPVEERKEADG